MRVRLRQAHSAEELARIYATPHEHGRYGYGHGLRVQSTIPLARWLAIDGRCDTVVDLSCGDAVIAEAVPVQRRILGDFAPRYELTGPIEQTLNQVSASLRTLFICSETVEHLDDPDAVLAAIREKATRLILSTPIGEVDQGNIEHYWGWDQEGVRLMLEQAGWTEAARIDVLLPDTYSYQIWACR